MNITEQKGAANPYIMPIEPGTTIHANSKVDMVNFPLHYRQHPKGIECIDVTEDMSLNIGSAIKYLWRHADKNGKEDLEKAIWYIEREIKRLYK